MVKPEVVPGRMAMLVTLFLVLINIFNSVREQAPISSRLNAVDLYLVVCIFFVFTALLEYAVILLMLKKRRKPRRTIDEGLKNLFSQSNSSSTTEPAAHSSRRKQPYVEVGLTARKQALVDNIDAWAMWISPPIFVLFNIIYWVAYRPWTNKLYPEYTLMDYVMKRDVTL